MPCDFTTGGGFILIAPGTASNIAGLPETGQKANFGLVAGARMAASSVTSTMWTTTTVFM